MPGAPSTRDVLLATANRLFYQRGITATGVDAVVKAAGLTKPTLYAHFPSKSALVTASLDRRYAERRADLESWAAGIADVSQRPLGVFEWLAGWYGRGGNRGCGFLNAAAELPDAEDPARRVVREEKRWLRDFLVRLCAEAGLAHPERLGSQLLLLADGVSGRVVVGGPEEGQQAQVDATEAAALLLGAGRQP